jgi:CRP-like cAMP-binding protein
MADSNTHKQLDEKAAGLDNGAEAVRFSEEHSEDPLLMIKTADELIEQKQLKQAADLYRRAMQQYAAAGKMLSAIAAKALELKVTRRATNIARDIYDLLHTISSNNIPSYEFFTKMSYDELLSILQSIEVEVIPPGSIVKQPGDPEADLYFIASGTMQEIPAQGAAEVTESSVTLIENSFIGDIYPFEEEKVYTHTLTSTTDVELLKITKHDLIRLAQKKYNFEFLCMELLSTRYDINGRRSKQIIRATQRYQLMTRVDIKILSDAPNEKPLVLNGFTEDLSLGGACICLSSAYLSGATNLIGKRVILALRVAKLLTGVDVPGTIAWKREVNRGKGKDIIIGIQFKEIPPDDFEFIKRHCYIGVGAEQMIYSLWQSCVTK